MKKLCWCKFKNGKCTIGFRVYDMSVDATQKKMVYSRPHLSVYTTEVDSMNEGQKRILGHITACSNTKDEGVKECRIEVKDENFEEVFNNIVE